jgi:hypothetical protein
MTPFTTLFTSPAFTATSMRAESDVIVGVA